MAKCCYTQINISFSFQQPYFITLSECALATDDWHHNKHLKLDRKWHFENGPRYIEIECERETERRKLKQLGNPKIESIEMILMFKKVTCRIAIATRYFKLFVDAFLSIQITCVYTYNVHGQRRQHAAVHQTSQQTNKKKTRREEEEYVFRLGETQLEKHQPKMITAASFCIDNATKAKLILALEFQFVPHIFRFVCVCECA